MRVVRTERGVRLLQGGAIVSEILAAPGPTDSLFDVLAAAIAMFARGPRIAVLGFAGGGIVAPLRAMGCGHPLVAVDLSRANEAIFRELSAGWCGDVRLDEGDAAQWLRQRRGVWDVVLEDLSVLGPDGETKPLVSLDELPALIVPRLSEHGIVIHNLLPVPQRSMRSLVRRVAAPHPEAVQILLDEFENRIVLAGPGLPSTQECGVLLRRGLRALGSTQSEGIQVRAVR